MLKRGDKIIIFGTGNQKKNIATYIADNYENVVAVVDNAIDKQGKMWHTHLVKPVVATMDYFHEDVYIIITAIRFHQEMKQQLLEMGWAEERIITAVKDIPFFSSYEFKLRLQEIDLDRLTPTLLNIELSGYCNCKCIYCPFHGETNLKEGHKGLMNEETMDAIISQIKKIPSITSVDTTGPGEIFINGKWFELLQKLLNETNIKDVVLYSNGMLLTDENIEKITLLNAKRIQIVISLDGTSAEENDLYRIGSKYEIIKNNIYKAKNSFEKISDKEIYIVITNCYPIALDKLEESNFRIDSKENIAVPEFLKNDFPNIPKTSQNTFFYGDKIDLSIFKAIKVTWTHSENRCANLFYRLPINYAGELLRCSCGHAGIEKIGDVFHDDILELWKSESEMNKARKNFIDKNVESDFCEGCPGKGLGDYYVLVKK